MELGMAANGIRMAAEWPQNDYRMATEWQQDPGQDGSRILDRMGPGWITGPRFVVVDARRRA